MPKVGQQLSSLELVSRDLVLPDGYQRMREYYSRSANRHGVTMDDLGSLKRVLAKDASDLYLYTQHQVVNQDGLKQTRSGPNWEGGMVTLCTCKHQMRTWNRDNGWDGVWIAGLGPQECANNCLLYVGKVAQSFASNFDLSSYVKRVDSTAWRIKQADTNPRGDLYTYREGSVWDHASYSAPEGHTRSVEFYKSSPGSVSTRDDGKVPKWWRDIEYLSHGNRPPSFVLSPCWMFSEPLAWAVGLQPRRAVLRLTGPALGAALQTGA